MPRLIASALLLAGLLLASSAAPVSAQEAAPVSERRFNHDSLVAGGTVHSFAADLGPISPFGGVGFKWDTFSDFQGIEGLQGQTIWEFIALGLTVYYFQGLSGFEVDTTDAAGAPLQLDTAGAFQVGILATMMYLPGSVHPYVGVGFAWTEIYDRDEALAGSLVLPMLDVNLGVRLDLNPTFFIDFSNYANWGRDGALGQAATQDILFFTTFLGLGVNVL
jgi:hypothetical protein